MNKWLISLALLTFFSACKKEECVPPPPSLLLRLVRTVGTLSTNIALQYTKNGSATQVTDVRVTTSTGNSVLLSSTEAIQMAPDVLNNTYTLLVDSKSAGTILLQTLARTEDCDKWQHIDQLKFNGVTQTPLIGLGYYELTLP